jgi:adenylate kinase family enzyme
MIEKKQKPKKILIIGQSGRGKSTTAKKLGEKLGLPVYSTDDYYWKVKFTEVNDKQESIDDIKKAFAQDGWVVEGSSTHLFRHGLETADVIIHLKFKYIISQWITLIKRSFGRKHERLIDILLLLKYVTFKRYGIGNDKEKRNAELLKPYQNKTIELYSYKEVNGFIKGL